jgi:hypothetical protein
MPAQRAHRRSALRQSNSIRPTGRSPLAEGSATGNASMRLPSGTYPTTWNVPMFEYLHFNQVEDGPDV